MLCLRSGIVTTARTGVFLNCFLSSHSEGSLNWTTCLSYILAYVYLNRMYCYLDVLLCALCIKTGKDPSHLACVFFIDIDDLSVDDGFVCVHVCLGTKTDQVMLILLKLIITHPFKLRHYTHTYPSLATSAVISGYFFLLEILLQCLGTYSSRCF